MGLLPVFARPSKPFRPRKIKVSYEKSKASKQASKQASRAWAYYQKAVHRMRRSMSCVGRVHACAATCSALIFPSDDWTAVLAQWEALTEVDRPAYIVNWAGFRDTHLPHAVNVYR